MTKHKYYEVRGPGERFACCYTESRITAIHAWAEAVYDWSGIGWRIYEITDGEERQFGPDDVCEMVKK